MPKLRLVQFILPVLLAATLTAGCRKAPKATNKTDFQAEMAAGSNSASIVVETNPDSLTPPPITPEAIPATSEASGLNSATVLESLTQSVRKYTVERRHLPKTLDEVVRAGYIPSLPAAPQGKKFALDLKSVRVILVDR
jgi:hypothetical protein